MSAIGSGHWPWRLSLAPKSVAGRRYFRNSALTAS